MTMKVPTRFIDAIGADAGNCILVVGAGLSKAGVRRGGAGIPDWDDLMSHMVRHLEDARQCDKAKIQQLRAMLAEDPPRYLDVAEEFSSAYNDDRDGYETFLRRHLKPDDLVESPLHKLILKIGFGGIVSFNFDVVFERQSDRLAPIVYPEFTDQMGQFQRRGFFAKMHGCITRPASKLVLTRTSYDELRRHPVYRDLVRAVLVAHKVLCVGFSLRDPDFQTILADLKSEWGEKLAPLYALMREPDNNVQSSWLKKGVVILPYESHHEVKDFFSQLVALPPNNTKPESQRPRGNNRRRRAKSSSPDDAQRHGTPSTSQLMDIAAFLEEWQEAQKIEEMDRLLSEQLVAHASTADKERLLFQLAALCRAGQAPNLCRHLVAVATSGCQQLASKLIADAAEDNNLQALKPHPLHVPVHQWLMAQPEWDFGGAFYDDKISRVLKWLLAESWGQTGINLWTTFLAILTRIKSSVTRHGLDDLYNAAEHIPGACTEIERIVLAPEFVREDDQEHRWFKSWDERIVSGVRFAKSKKLLDGKPRSPSEMLAEASAIEASQDEGDRCAFTEMVVERLLDEFVQRTHMTVHGHSTLYDPAKAREILDALADLRKQRQQMTVLWTINRWPERMRGLGSLMEDSESLRKQLLVPLWWRFATEVRVEYLQHLKRGMSPHPQWTGQEFLLEDMMGLRYDIDQDFRDAFNRSLDRYRDPKEPDSYEPRPLQELWRDRELRYELSEECPPEIVRRLAVSRVDWENLQPGSVRWAEAQKRAQEVWSQRQHLRECVSAERGNYVIDNLLGAYFPAQRRIVLYSLMARCAAKDLEVDANSLLTVAYIHETVHAFSHLGRDLNGRMWEGYSLPLADSPDEQLIRPHEAIAQYYTFKLLEHLNDTRLLRAFVSLEKAANPIYRAWRETERLSLEGMRRLIVEYRSRSTDWPPSG